MYKIILSSNYPIILSVVSDLVNRVGLALMLGILLVSSSAARGARVGLALMTGIHSSLVPRRPEVQELD